VNDVLPLPRVGVGAGATVVLADGHALGLRFAWPFGLFVLSHDVDLVDDSPLDAAEHPAPQLLTHSCC